MAFHCLPASMVSFEYCFSCCSIKDNVSFSQTVFTMFLSLCFGTLTKKWLVVVWGWGKLFLSFVLTLSFLNLWVEFFHQFRKLLSHITSNIAFFPYSVLSRIPSTCVRTLIVSYIMSLTLIFFFHFLSLCASF